MLFLALMTGCQASNCITFDENTAMSRRTLTMDDTGTTLALKPGDMLVIELNEAPGTGYRWTLQQGAQDILPLLDSTFTPASKGVGGSGTRVWTFKAGTSGETRLVLKRSRSWEPSNPAAETFEAEIRVSR
jgi:predicted secreted protein